VGFPLERPAQAREEFKGSLDFGIVKIPIHWWDSN